MWECAWDQKKVRYLPTYQFPRILQPFEPRNVEHISSLVSNDQLFGFVECDLSSPDWLISKYSHLNFPPIIKRHFVKLDEIGPYMVEVLAKLGRKIPESGLETVINCYHGKKLLIFTPLLKERFNSKFVCHAGYL